MEMVGDDGASHGSQFGQLAGYGAGRRGVPLSWVSGVIVMTISSQSRRVGSTGLSLPLFGFGSAYLGGLYDRVSGDMAKLTLDAAWSGGVRFFDTSPYYGHGLAEHRLGSCLIDKPRDEFVLTTKIGRVFQRPGDPRSFDPAPWSAGLH